MGRRGEGWRMRGGGIGVRAVRVIVRGGEVGSVVDEVDVGIGGVIVEGEHVVDEAGSVRRVGWGVRRLRLLRLRRLRLLRLVRLRRRGLVAGRVRSRAAF